MGMSSNGFEEEGGPISAINVTPLVDVMLVLLVIFMITAPMLQQGVEVNLPKATTAPLSGSEEQVVVSIDKKNTIFLGAGNPVEPDALAAKIRAILDKRPANEQKVYIKADTDLDYGAVMTVMGKLHAGGVSQIGLISAFPEAGSKPETKSTAKKSK